MPDNQQRTAVLIAGMHRSGTSALAHTLGLAGCDLPKTLMEPRLNTSERSLKGHSESRPITLLNVEILSSVNHHGFEEVNLHFGNSDLDTQFSERAVMALQSEFSDSDLFVLKDPRLCLLMQFWIDAVTAFGARAVVICPIRNPLEVISSLKARSKNDRRSHKYLLLLWLRYVLTAEASSRNIPRTFTRYNDLRDNPLTVLRESADALDVSWPRISSPTVEKDICHSLSPTYRHYRATQEDLCTDAQCRQSIKLVFDIFNRWTQGDVRPSDAAELDRVKEIVDEVTSALVDVVSDRDAKIRAIRNTLSWRLTAPLRSAKALQKRIMP